MYKLFTYNINYNISNKNYLKNFHFLIFFYYSFINKVQIKYFNKFIIKNKIFVKFLIINDIFINKKYYNYNNIFQNKNFKILNKLIQNYSLFFIHSHTLYIIEKLNHIIFFLTIIIRIPRRLSALLTFKIRRIGSFDSL